MKRSTIQANLCVILFLLATFTLTTGTMAQEPPAGGTKKMSTNIHRNPTGGYTRRSVEIPPGSRVLFISGQTATDEDGNTPADAETQADIVYQKIVQSLADADMGVEDLVKTNVYMVNPGDIGAIIKAGQKYNPGGSQAGTLVYVKALAYPDVLIEIEAVAARKE
jgi:enamine deaminase RidA (YjgF/YER057c/UK114 family)